MERRPPDKPRPVFIWVDESQNFNADYDMQFQATARSSKACTVYLTQNLENYYAEMGNEHRVNSLIANLATKIWHAQSDPNTNEKAAETIGRSWQVKKGTNQQIGGASVNIGESEQLSLEYDVIPQTFTTLRTGGPLNSRIVEAVIFQNGRIWENGQSHIIGLFKQS
nr:type IV secretory system conjugative DNA transfer family protein [Tunicatimonas sp. TK19036]